MKVDWDETIDKDVWLKWERFLKELLHYDSFRVERFLLGKHSDKILQIEVHGFCDSSEVAYAAVVYAKMTTGTGVQVKLLSAKSKVAPLKKVTIPRLELLSCLLLAKLITSVKNAIEVEIELTRYICWSDAEIALYWLKNLKKEWRPWVENRVNEVRNLIDCEFWRHVPGKLNPADLATREGTVNDLLCDHWLRGPEFLVHDEELWPSQKDFGGPLPTHVLVEAKEDRSTLKTNVCLNTTEVLSIQEVVNLKKFSSFSRLCRVTAFVIRFIANLKKSVEKKYDDVIKDDDVTVTELENAEIMWLRYSQETMMNDTKMSQLIKSLNLYQDENSLYRSKTRLSESRELKTDVKFPIVLPSQGHLTKIIILDAHEKVLHMRTETTLNKLRTRFWIIRGRQTVKNVISKCVICKVAQGRTLLPRPLPSLPSYRVCSEYPFQSIGLDFAGPLLVKDIYLRYGNMHKAYVLLFTCATTRAVHLELTPDMGASSFLLTFRRFIGRKGCPKNIVSDNAKSFKSSAVKKFMRSNHIEWTFILERSPNWGGFYERLVKIMKDSLHKVVRNAKLTFDELNTILVEIEAMMNSRPLSYFSEDDLEPITPYHLLHGRNITGDFEYNLMSQKNMTECDTLTKRAAYIRLLIKNYWSRFYNEYTVALRERVMYDKTKRSSTNLEVGDVVLIKEDKITPRGNWKRGRVTELLSGRDKVVRGAKLSVVTNGNKVAISRPLIKLIPLEITNTSKEKVAEQIDDDDQIPRRGAFLTGQSLRRLQNMSVLAGECEN